MNLNLRDITLNRGFAIARRTNKNICMKYLTEWKKERLNHIRKDILNIIKTKISIQILKNKKFKIITNMVQINHIQMNILKILINLTFITKMTLSMLKTINSLKILIKILYRKLNLLKKIIKMIIHKIWD